MQVADAVKRQAAVHRFCDKIILLLCQIFIGKCVFRRFIGSFLCSGDPYPNSFLHIILQERQFPVFHAPCRIRTAAGKDPGCSCAVKVCLRHRNSLCRRCSIAGKENTVFHNALSRKLTVSDIQSVGSAQTAVNHCDRKCCRFQDPCSLAAVFKDRAADTFANDYACCLRNRAGNPAGTGFYIRNRSVIPAPRDPWCLCGPGHTQNAACKRCHAAAVQLHTAGNVFNDRAVLRRSGSAA